MYVPFGTYTHGNCVKWLVYVKRATIFIMTWDLISFNTEITGGIITIKSGKYTPCAQGGYLI